MRVTNNMMVNTFLSNLNNNMREMDKIQQHLSTGKKLNKPSDDPINIIYSLRLNSGLSEIERYTANVNSASSWLELTDTTLDNVGNILQVVRQRTINGANDSLPQASRIALAEEIKQLREQLLQLGNTSYDGRYIFAGHQTTTVPFNTLTGAYNGDSGIISYEVGAGINININVPGDQAFKAPVDMFQLLTDISNDLVAGNTANLSGVHLAAIDTATDNLLSIRSQIGAKVNRMELTVSRLEETKIGYSELLSAAEDVNTAEAITQLKMQENTYRAALAAGARIIPPSLVDFLR